MSIAKLTTSSEDLAEIAKRFLEENPVIRQALEQVGLTLDQYHQTLAVQQKPVLYNSTSTM